MKAMIIPAILSIVIKLRKQQLMMNESNNAQPPPYPYQPQQYWYSSTEQQREYRYSGAVATNEGSSGLPVIYDSPNRNSGSATKYTGSSRVLYDPRDSRSREPRIVVNDTSNRSGASLSPPPANTITTHAHTYQQSQKKASNSRVIIHPPSNITQVPTNITNTHTYPYPYTSTSTSNPNPNPPSTSTYTHTYPNRIPAQTFTTSQTQPWPPQQHHHQPPSQSIYRQARMNASIPISNSSSRITSQISMESVPRIQYDRCVIECKNWETKYNELYLKYLNLNSRFQEPAAHEREFQELEEQNRALRRQLNQQKTRNNRMTEKLEANFTEMVERQKEATFKQLELLVDRFRLQSRHAE